MCGIIGYVGEQTALPIVREGLKNLEYRGYDSAGVALENGDLDVIKQEGAIDDLDLPADNPANVGIGHTRWSTHGKPTDLNAHPHTDCSGEIAVVHNGIIDNYNELKAGLRDRGHDFVSETDTEVIPHLLEEAIDEGLLDAVQSTVEQLEGSFAFVAIAHDHDGIVAARRDSPLVVGHGDDGEFIASDVTAFLDHAREVTYLEDDDVVWLTDDHVEIYHDGALVDREVHTVDWEAEAAEKGGYEHYMLKEIHEQPRSLRQTISGRIDELNGEADLEIDLPAEYLNSLEEIQFVAAGTSYHAGLYAKHLLQDLANIRVTVEIASEYAFEGGRDPWRTLVVGISQSGETADTLDAIRQATRAGAKTLAVTNTVGSTITREVDDSVFIRAGPEIGVAATKTFVTQVVTLLLLAIYLGRARETLSAESANDILADLRGLPGGVQQVLDEEATVRAVAEAYGDGAAFFFIGRRLGGPVALEGALKLKEISYDHAEGFPAGELKHGPLALVTEETPVLAVLTEGSRAEETLDNVKEVESRGAPVIGCTSEPAAGKFLDDRLEVPELGLLEPLAANVYFQLFAYYVALQKGRPIDKPRNLAKSVTVK